jgi:DNA-binding SARP family transcriptional activator
MSKGELESSWLIKGSVGWPTVREFIQASQYERVAEFLSQAQAASEQKGDAVLADTLSAAYQICLASSQCRSEVEWHRQACKEADQREHELKQQLCAILDLLNGHKAPEKEDTATSCSALATELKLRERDISQASRRFGLLHRLSNLLGQGGGIPSPEREKSARAESVKAPAAPYRERSRAPTVISQRDAKALNVSPGAQKEQQGRKSPSFTIYCLGTFRVCNNEQLVEKWPGCKCKSVFKYLVVHRERPVHREILMDLFWRDVDPEAARRNLYQAIYSLRQALQSNSQDFPYVLCEDGCYYLNPELELWVDSEAFTLHYQTGQRLEREGHIRQAVREYEAADSLYEGEFLAEDRYEDWPLVQREHLKHAHLDILDRLSQHYFDQAQFAPCVAFCQKILAEDICREDAHRRLMRCYLQQNQRHLALRQYHLCIEALEQELNVSPMPSTVELYRQVWAHRVQFPGG